MITYQFTYTYEAVFARQLSKMYEFVQVHMNKKVGFNQTYFAYYVT